MIENVIGDRVFLKTTNPRHYGPNNKGAVSADFLDIFKTAVAKTISDTNRSQVSADNLMIKMITKPDSVNIHDVMIAQQKAQLALDYTSTILQKAVQAYQKITNLR